MFIGRFYRSSCRDKGWGSYCTLHFLRILISLPYHYNTYTQQGRPLLGLLNHTVCKLVNFIHSAFWPSPVRLNKWSYKYMRAWHIYSYTWQDTPLFKKPKLPRMTQTWRKTLSGHFQALTDNWMGWWQASSSRTGSKPGPSYKSKEEFLSVLSPSQCIHRSCGYVRGRKREAVVLLQQ